MLSIVGVVSFITLKLKYPVPVQTFKPAQWKTILSYRIYFKTLSIGKAYKDITRVFLVNAKQNMKNDSDAKTD